MSYISKYYKSIYSKVRVLCESTMESFESFCTQVLHHFGRMFSWLFRKFSQMNPSIYYNICFIIIHL